jgi:hypothetical protein
VTRPDAATAFVIFSWLQIVAVTVMWPISIFTFGASEPQTVLHLSWAAIYIAAVGNLLTAHVNKHVRS